MKVGIETNSLVNHLYSRMTNGQPEPTAGMGATILKWSDRTAATVIAWDGNVLTIQEDDAKRVDKNGMSDCQDYEYTPNPHGSTHTFRRNKAGGWKPCWRDSETRRWRMGEGGLIVGLRQQYHDYSF